MFLVLVLCFIVDSSLDLSSLEVEIEFNIIVTGQKLESLLANGTISLHLNKRIVLIVEA